MKLLVGFFLLWVIAGFVWEVVKLARTQFMMALLLACILFLLAGCAPSGSRVTENIFGKSAMIFGGLAVLECLFWYIVRRDIPSLKYVSIALSVVALLLVIA